MGKYSYLTYHEPIIVRMKIHHHPDSARANELFGKEFKATYIDHGTFNIEGKELARQGIKADVNDGAGGYWFCLMEGCAFLSGGDWEVLSPPPPGTDEEGNEYEDDFT